MAMDTGCMCTHPVYIECPRYYPGVGCMSGLTLGLLSLDIVELEVLKRSGSEHEQHCARVGASPICDRTGMAGPQIL